MKKVLIIDDAMFMRGSIKMMLERNGFEIVGDAEDGKVGIKKYIQLKPDLVTMDITMPVMDGIEAVKQIMKIDLNAKILMVSALGQESMVKEAIISGAKGFIVKPFTEEKLVKALNSL